MLEFDIVGKLFPNALTMLVQLCVTGILFYFIKKYLWASVHDYLNKRAEHSQSLIEQANKLNLDAKKANEEAKVELKEATLKARDIIELAKKESLVIKENTLKETREEVQAKLQNVKLEIEQERNRLKEDIRKEMVDIAMEATTKLISEQANEELNKKSIEKFIEEMSN